MLGLSVLGGASLLAANPAVKRPNFVVILVDDLGFGDLGVTGNPVIQTPNIDRMAAEGLRFTSFCAAPVCTPSRGMLLTGRYSTRTGLLVPTGPGSPAGIRKDEVTLADVLKKRGYKTAMVGKWHLGDFESNPDFNPVRHGFDSFFGLPYSHDYNPIEPAWGLIEKRIRTHGPRTAGALRRVARAARHVVRPHHCRQ